MPRGPVSPHLYAKVLLAVLPNTAGNTLPSWKTGLLPVF